MPNWCSNTLTVTGPVEELNRFREEVKGEVSNEGKAVPYVLSFNNHVRVWDEIGEPIKGMGPYEDWGTKWDVNSEDTTLQESGDSLVYNFSTAWGPAVAWLETVAGLFPTLTFESIYEEPGCEIYGVSKSEGDGGIITTPMDLDEYLGTYDETYPYYLENIKEMSPEDLVTYFSGVTSFYDCCCGNDEWNDDLDARFMWSENDTQNFSVLAKHIIDKIDANDLPLFLNVDWGSYQNLFKERLAKGE